MQKEMDFDIILNSCKQRIDFQQAIEEMKIEEKFNNFVKQNEMMVFENNIADESSEEIDAALMESAMSGLSSMKLPSEGDHAWT